MGHESEHRELAEALQECRATVILSGYAHPLYEEIYTAWDRVETKAATGQNAAKGWQERTEVLWRNRPFPRQAALFDHREDS